MRALILALAAAAALSLVGCASTASHLGNHITTPNVDHQALAAEAVNQIAALWPPAKTQLDLKQATPDPFGAALIAGLRERGYALMEYSPTSVSTPQSEASATSALALSYLLDESQTTPVLFRVTLTIGSQAITRPYMNQDGKLYPAGYWVRKE